MLLIVAGVVLFVIGASLLLRGYQDMPAPQPVLPESDYRELEDTLEAVRNSERQLQSQLLAAQKQLNELENAPKADDRVHQLEEDIRSLKQENETIRSQDTSAKDVNVERYEQQLAQAGAECERLRKENESLQQQRNESLDRLRQLEAEVSLLQQKNENQLKQIEEKYREQTAELTAQNNDLQSQLQEKIERIRELDGATSQTTETVSGLKTTVQMLQSQLEERAVKLSQLETQVPALQSEMDQLRQEKGSWEQTKAGLEENIHKLKEFNGHLLEKDRMIQYELAKSRAQAMGFEKINEDFKDQLDQMYKTVESFKKR
jgi:chromosome segregation ATPase